MTIMKKNHTSYISKVIVLSVLLFIIIPLLLYCPRHITVWGYSMKPSINDGDVVDVMPYRTYKMLDRTLKIGDIIIIQTPREDRLESVEDEFIHNEERLRHELDKSIKRIVAVDGDVVEIVNGILYVNDEVVQHNYLGDESYGKLVCDGYYVLGDNPYFSMDSRYFGCIKDDNILYVVRDQDKYKNMLGGL